MARRTTKPTLSTLAEMCGVSKTTVSNAFNYPDRLSHELREYILATAAGIGYPGPHPTARSLNTRQTGVIGVLLTEHLTYAFEDLASVDFLAGLARATSNSGHSVLLLPAGPHATDEAGQATRLMNAHAVDGFVVYSVAADDPYLQAATTHRIPIVICDQPTGVKGAGFVGIDDAAAIAPAAAALVAAGHRHIGMLTIRLSREVNNGIVDDRRLATATHHVQQSRVRGALGVFAAAGIPRSDITIVERHINDPVQCYDAAAELLAAFPAMTAVLCTTDSMALGMLQVAADRGIAVPNQLSITGFDGITTAFHHQLTTVIQPNKDKGEAAAQLLLEAIAAGEQGSSSLDGVVRLLPTKFAPGATVAAPRTGSLPGVAD
ncbi:LacI family DNA-binding transcriptional regulator [Corynebacterium choanae]|uniref:Catabolite control protein A n=1 Tax=Corynebacterium choanae TaxID=1862358 RepID=A0A3G6J3V6_9CORY|nr:LacI family DNA-binding transcriptional regulator [Corynebacterium choanae]AZA12771.1 Catabolite control protein A [Corynebacterium choanae]